MENENEEDKSIHKKKIIIYIIVFVVAMGFGFLTDNLFDKKPDSSVHLNIKCDDVDLSKDYKEKDNIECKLSGEEYVFTIKKISKDKVELYSKNCLTINGSDCPNNIELVKGKALQLKTVNKDDIKNVIMEW